MNTADFRSFLSLAVVLASLAISTACSQMPTVGPSRDEIEGIAKKRLNPTVQVVEVSADVVRRLAEQRRFKLFSETLGSGLATTNVGSGDSVEVTLWEAPPATLFGGGAIDPRNPSTVRATTLPEQVVDRDGFINVPFAGRIRAGGLSPQSIATDIVARLKGKANQPEALVRVLRNASSTVTVVGDVANSTRMPLTAGGERVLDALAAAGGVRQPIPKMTLQVTRGKQFQSMPLDVIIRDPEQNVPLQPGDVVALLYQPLSFTALGATGKNEEIAFEAQGITLAQALARAGGLVDARSNPQGVFIFRLESEKALDWPRQPVVTTPDGLVPVVYQLDLRDPVGFFMMQSFPISNRDVLYVSNAPSAELQKFLNLVFTIVYPVLSTIQITR